MNQRVSVTVAAMAEREGRFLVVEEETDEGVRLNQPAGHLEPEESLIEAVVRETLEETAYGFVPRSLLGVYRWRHPAKGISYVRFAFVGEVTGPETGRALAHSCRVACSGCTPSQPARAAMHTGLSGGTAVSTRLVDPLRLSESALDYVTPTSHRRSFGRGRLLGRCLASQGARLRGDRSVHEELGGR